MTPTMVLRSPDGHRAAWAHSLGRGAVGDIEAKWRWSAEGSGLWTLSFSIAAPSRYEHPLLRRGTIVDLSMSGLEPLGTAVVADIDRSGWRLTCDGLVRAAERFVAFDNDSPYGAVLQANSSGMGWGDPSDRLPSTSLGDPGAYAYVADVLKAHAEQSTTRWGIDGQNRPFDLPDPDDVSLVLGPGVPGLATANDNYASRLVVRFPLSGPSETGEQTYGYGAAELTDPPLGLREVREDWTGTFENGAIELALQRRLRAGGLAGVVEPGRGHIRTARGLTPDAWVPLHGRRVAQFGVPDLMEVTTPMEPTTWVVGGYTYRQGQAPLLEPVDPVPVSLPQLTAAGAA